jgi:hypothetical protein
LFLCLLLFSLIYFRGRSLYIVQHLSQRIISLTIKKESDCGSIASIKYRCTIIIKNYIGFQFIYLFLTMSKFQFHSGKMNDENFSKTIYIYIYIYHFLYSYVRVETVFDMVTCQLLIGSSDSLVCSLDGKDFSVTCKTTRTRRVLAVVSPSNT